MITEPFRKISKKIVEAERTLGLKIKPTKCDIFSLVTSLKNDGRQF